MASLVYGAADFIGGIASRRSSTLSVVVISQIVGLLLFFVLLPLMPHAAPTHADLGWGLAAGAAGGLGIVFLYRGLAIGRMSLVSPVAALLGALIPLAAGLLLQHERPSATALAGVGLALVAVVLVSSSEHPGDPASNVAPGLTIPLDRPQPKASLVNAGLPPGLLEAMCSGVAIGGFLFFLSHSGREAGLWPLAAARTSSISMLFAIALFARRSLRPQPGSLAAIVSSGALDMSANACYLLATRYGLLSLVVVISSLYPASTVLLARVVLKERLGITQLVGVACALAAVALIAGGTHA